MLKRQVGELEIVVSQGDLTECSTDAIVNAANNRLWMGGGVAGAIKRKGGSLIEKEAVKKGPIPVGEAVATGAGSLKARYVIHAAGMGEDLKTDKEKIALSTRNSLRRAEELSLRSIAFPAIGTGVGGFPAEEAAGAMLGSIIEHAEAGGGSLREVHLVLFSPELLGAFEATLKRLIP